MVIETSQMDRLIIKKKKGNYGKLDFSPEQPA